MQIGPYTLPNNLALAPMAGITDRPFREICRSLGAGFAVSEMVSSNAALWGRAKTRRRIDHQGEPQPRAVQIAGADPAMMAAAARFNVDHGAQIIDINLGCPAKKVCNALAGSALLRDEALVGRILERVVAAVDVPVTVKMRTGWDPAHRNGVIIARIAEEAGAQAIAVHGRTRACGYCGPAEYDTIRAIKAQAGIPIIANGDIRTPQQARHVLTCTGADGVMIGRAAQGRPWLFRAIERFLGSGAPEPTAAEFRTIILRHMDGLYRFYGKSSGVLVARKHLCWYSRGQPGGATFRQAINRSTTVEQQMALTRDYFDRVAMGEELAA